jgi:hypothetical protein
VVSYERYRSFYQLAPHTTALLARSTGSLPFHRYLGLEAGDSCLVSELRNLYVSTRLRSWLRHYATSQKDTGSNPDEVTGFLNLPNPSSRNMALGSTQPLSEMSTRNLPEGGEGRPARKADNLTTILEPII